MKNFLELSQEAEKDSEEYLKKHSKEQSLMFATWILQKLSDEHYVAWQTYTKEDVKCIKNVKKVSDEYMDRLHENISECFCYIEPEDCDGLL